MRTGTFLDYKVGDLVQLIHDAYIFIDDKAFMIKKGQMAIVIEAIDDGPDLEIFSKGRRDIWKGSLKIHDEFGRLGWIHAGNVQIL